MKAVKLRDATEADLPAIVEIHNPTVPTHTATADTEPVSVESRGDWFHEHDPAIHPFWVTESDGEIAGWISLGPFYDGRSAYHATAEVSVYIHKDHRRKRIGRKLLVEAIRRVSALGLKTLTGGIFARNEPSLKLFEGFGFERWAYFPNMAELDSIERELIVLGPRLDKASLSE